MAHLVRPTGLTVILLVIGIALVFLSLGSLNVEMMSITGNLKPLTMVPITIDAALISIAISSIVIVYGLLDRRSWAWIASIILSFIEIAMGVIGIMIAFIVIHALNSAGIIATAGIVSVAINGVILSYLYKKGIKEYLYRISDATNICSLTFIPCSWFPLHMRWG